MNEIQNKLSFKSIRQEKNLPIEYIAVLVDISTDLLELYESTPQHIPVSLAAELSAIYETPLSKIDFSERNLPTFTPQKTLKNHNVDDTR